MEFSDIQLYIPHLKQRYYQLIIIVVQNDNCFIQKIPSIIDFPPQIIELNLFLSQHLKNNSSTNVPQTIFDLLQNNVALTKSDLLILTKIDILFLPHLKLDPMQLFYQISRTIPIIVLWNGAYQNDKLIYSQSGRPDYRTYTNIAAKIFNLNHRS